MLSTQAVSADPLPQKPRAQENELTSFVEQFLEDSSYNAYQEEDREIEESILAPEEAEALEAQSMKTRTAEGAPEGFSIDPDFMAYHTGKTELLKVITEQMAALNDYEVSYEILNVETQGDYAVVDMQENLSFQYELFDGPSFMSTLYRVSLLQENGEWVVTDMESDSSLDQTFDRETFDAEAEIQAVLDSADEDVIVEAVDLDLEDDSDEVALSVESASGSETLAVINNKQITYERQFAAYYGTQYTTTTTANAFNNYYNNHFQKFGSTGNSSIKNPMENMNFNSQCIWAGLNGSDDQSSISAMKPPCDQSGQYTWYSSGKNGIHSSTWTNNAMFYDYALNNSKDQGKADFIGFQPPLEMTGSTLPIKYSPSQYMGALLQNYNHTWGAIVSEIKNTSRDGVGVCAHANDMKNVPLSLAFGRSERLHVIIPTAFHYQNSDLTIGVSGQWIECQPINKPVILSGKASQMAYRMSIRVVDPNGKEIAWTYPDPYNTNHAQVTCTFKTPGIHYVTVFARNVAPDVAGSHSTPHTFAVRAY